MSSAFYTIDRKELLTILKEIVEEELRIIQFLLSETTLYVKVNGCTQEIPFTTNMGTPQGDSLSPVLFAIYVFGKCSKRCQGCPEQLTAASSLYTL
ncbi:very-long-chain enoyl-CoA reductase [Elysia marginata]|uniref:Very-long-chain enoyl-CoA reductase n=1 Tax=Elysia marginata TaxID=1093978 RepID=A0AAV4IXY1_9GAST|nr:very-long-chain enoyl-CoA reductase [Elysia marginata]